MNGMTRNARGRTRRAAKGGFIPLLVAAALALMPACSGDRGSTPFFQNNAGSTSPAGGGGWDPFDGMPGNGDPSVAEQVINDIIAAFNPGADLLLNQDPTDYEVFVSKITQIADNHPDAARDVLAFFDGVANSYGTGHSMYGLMAALHAILGYVIDQDALDDDIGGGYAGDLFSYMDDIDAADLGIKTDLYRILFKSISYLDGTYDDAATENIMDSLRDFTGDGTGQTFSGLIYSGQGALGKLLLQADTNIQWDDPADDLTDGHGVEDTQLGNAVAGVDSLMVSMNDMMKNDEAAKQNVYDLIRELGKLLGARESGNLVFKTKIKQLLTNLEDYYTSGGSQFNGNYYNASNPYVNADLRNTVKEMWPSLAKYFIRERDDSYNNSDYSIVSRGQSLSAAEWLTRALHQLKKNANIDYATNTTLEESLKRLVQYNAYGQVRGGGNYEVSFLDHLVFTISSSYHFGYLTRNSSSGEPYRNDLDDTGSWGHARSTGGVLTVNDSMYSLTTGSTNGKDSYGLALAHRRTQGSHVWRSYNYFTKEARGGHSFYMGYDFPNLLLLPSNCAGDAGIPNGGETAFVPPNNYTVGDDYKTYFPRVADGKGILNTSSFMMAWIARACWDGQGPYYATSVPAGKPATVNFDIPGDGHGAVDCNVYYKPNGEVYCFVYKEVPGTPSTWHYFYPNAATQLSAVGVTSNDANDQDDPAQRANRYRDTVKSDYYLIEHGDNGDGFCAPPMNPDGWDKINYSWGDPEKYELDSEGSGSGHNSSYFQIYERVREKSASRECDTQEIAMYRNYQWLTLEKKFMFILPMNINTSVCWIEIDAAAFVVIEGNGFLGLANARKGSGNGRWSLLGTEGDWSQTNGTVTNGPDYYDSSYRGDGRIIAFVNPDGVNQPLPDDIFNDVLKGGYVMPDIVGRNIFPAINMGLPTQDNIGNNFQNTIASNSNKIGTEGDTDWDNRNKFLPIFIALTGSLMDGTRYEAAGSGYNYNYDGKHKYPLDEVLEGIIIPLGKPALRYWTDEEAYGDTEPGHADRGRWVPRINDENRNAWDGSPTDFDFFYPSFLGSPPDYRPRTGIRTLISLLQGNSSGTNDGLVPLITDNTRLVTKLFALLQRLGNDDPGSIYRDDGMAVLSNFSFGLEGILTAVQVPKSGALAKTGASRLDHSRHGWIFTNNEDRTDGSPAPVSVDLNAGLNELIGSDGLNKGIAKFVDNREAFGWTNYDRLFDSLGVMMGTPASNYYLTEDIIGIMHKMMTGATSADLRALRHTLGVLCTRYDGSWQTNTELRDILRHYLPEILSAYDGNYADLVTVTRGLINYDYNETMNDDLIEYMGDLLIPDEVTGSEDTLNYIHDLTGRDAMWDAAYYDGSYPNHAVWKELAAIFQELASRI